MDPISGDEYDEPLASDAESLDADDHDQDLDFKRETSNSPGSGVPDSKTSNGHHGGAGGSSNAHLQKRRRVTRACDECRRKKIKCDGKQPCTHCTVYSYECTYDQPSNRRRNPAPQYVENLEHRVHRAESLLHILFPNLDLNDPGIDAAVAQGWIPGAPGKGAPATMHAPTQLPLPAGPPRQHPPSSMQMRVSAYYPPANEPDPKADTNIESMLRAVAQLDMDESGDWGYHGHSSGLSFMRRMREQLGDVMGPEITSSPFSKSRPMNSVLDSPKSLVESPSAVASNSDSPGLGELPPQANAREFCTHAIEDSSALLRIVHPPSYWESFDRLYHIPPDQYTNEDQKFLPLFYSTLAVGMLFNPARHNSENYEEAIQEGVTYFRLARSLIDAADCRGIPAIQTVLFLTLFLQSSAKLSQCYSYVGVALRSAMRMGLHRTHGDRFNPLESEVRKRVFWAVRKMDIYVSAMLGLPLTLSDEDIDQEFPIEVDDEYVTREAINPMPEGQVSLMTAFNMHTRVVQILAKIVHVIYPINATSAADKSYSVPFSAIRNIESDLEQWKQCLPSILNPCPAPKRYHRVQYLLRLTYAHAQVMLYRPFLHFVAYEKRANPIDQRSYACAASYVSVSRNIVHIQTQMQQKGLLDGAFWFTQYTAFFAILSLVYFAAENPDNTATEGVMKDALEGKTVLASLAQRSMAADRCTATLNGVFGRLPEWMRNGQPNPVLSRKRHHDASRGHADVPVSSGGGRNDSVHALPHQHHQHQHPHQQHIHPHHPPPPRASTFPMHTSATTATASKLSTTSPLSAKDAWSTSGVVSPAGSSMPATSSMPDFAQHSAVTAAAANAAAAAAAAGAGYMPYAFSHAGTTAQPQQQVAGGVGGVSGADGTSPYGMPIAGFANPALADISMMFPAADEPFHYPTQPLTTYENQQLLVDGGNGNQMNTNHPSKTNPSHLPQSFPHSPNNNNNLNPSDPSSSSTLPPHRPPPTSSSSREDGMEPQFYALPPYLDHRQQAAQQRFATLANAGALAGPTPNQNGAIPPFFNGGVWGPQQQQQQAGTPASGVGGNAGDYGNLMGGNGNRGLGQQQHPQQQQPQPQQQQQAINIQDVFGGSEWNPLLLSGYGAL